MCEGQGKRTVMRGKTVKRIWAVALAAAMGMSLMACNNETSSNAGSDSVVGEKVTTSNDENSQYVYIADFQNEALLSDTDDSWVSSMDFQENGIIYNKVVFDEEKNVDVPYICYRDFNELSKKEAVNLPAFSMDGYETHISTFCCDTNNNYYVFYELYLPYVEGEEDDEGHHTQENVGDDLGDYAGDLGGDGYLMHITGTHSFRSTHNCILPP